MWVEQSVAMTWLWWAPLGMTILHILEEFVLPGGFPTWDRAYRPEIRESITPRLHLVVNSALLLLCLQVGFLGETVDTEARGIGVVLWVGVSALLVSNALFHLVGSLRTRSYSPGMITAALLYVPVSAFGSWHFLRTGAISPLPAAVAAAIGGSYHLWARWLHDARARRASRRTEHPPVATDGSARRR